MLTLDPLALARRQIELDRKRTTRFPHLFDHKVERMIASPLALLRGSATVFYEVLDRHPSLADGPAGSGWLVGDAHIENFGAYRAGALSVSETLRSHATEQVVFDLNDFDDAIVGPWRWDVLRLATSLVLGGREMGADGKRTLGLVEELLDAYVSSVFRGRRAPAAPPVVTNLVETVRTRTRRELLDSRTEVVRGGVRRFVRGPRYEAISPRLRERAERAFLKYTKKLARADRPNAEALEVLDAAFRIAGTGSLGCTRIAVLVRGKGGRDGAWIFDMKSQDAPSAACLVRPPKMPPADRVYTAMRESLARAPRMIGVTRMRGQSMFVRRLTPQEDRIDLTRLEQADLEPLARHYGALLGAAHKRGADRVPEKPWRDKDREGILHRAVALAGAHEAMYLAYCNLVRR
jgi:uncharacterized protein (DUF2252 family)